MMGVYVCTTLHEYEDGVSLFDSWILILLWTSHIDTKYLSMETISL